MNRVAWLINRLRVMTLREVLFRCHGHACCNRWNVTASPPAGSQLPEYRVAPRLALFGNGSGTAEDVAAVIQSRPGSALRITWLAASIFSATIPWMSEVPVAWQRDPVTRDRGATHVWQVASTTVMTALSVTSSLPGSWVVTSTWCRLRWPMP